MKSLSLMVVNHLIIDSVDNLEENEIEEFEKYLKGYSQLSDFPSNSDLKNTDKLFNLVGSYAMIKFERINDKLELGKRGTYNCSDHMMSGKSWDDSRSE